MTQAAALAAYGSNSPSNRNRIINGDMRIDQRNGGAAVNTSSSEKYIVDRWRFFENGSMDFSGQRSTTAPAGFTNTVLITTATAASPGSTTRSQLQHVIEGLNISDLGWGAVGAQSVTLSFWVRSSLTGQFGGSLQNAAQNYSYPFSFTINAANTFEFKTVTISGPTSGTWNSDNTGGIILNFDLGMGPDIIGTAGSWSANDYRGVTGDVKLSETNGATFYITGVQLEAGSVATPFEHRQYGQELALCQRYFIKYGGNNVYEWVTSYGATYVSTLNFAPVVFPVEMRATPSVSGGTLRWGWQGGGVAVTSVQVDRASPKVFGLQINTGGGETSYRPGYCITDNSLSGFLSFSAEL